VEAARSVVVGGGGYITPGHQPLDLLKALAKKIFLPSLTAMGIILFKKNRVEAE
jgi:hypothetical protein